MPMVEKKKHLPECLQDACKQAIVIHLMCVALKRRHQDVFDIAPLFTQTSQHEVDFTYNKTQACVLLSYLRYL